MLQAWAASTAGLDGTVAIIIPVLFLALGVQRHLYQGPAEGLLQRRPRSAAAGPTQGTQMVPPLLITVATGAVTTFILVYGTVGEVDAILALSNRHPVGSATPVVAAVGLAIAVAARPRRYCGPTSARCGCSARRACGGRGSGSAGPTARKRLAGGRSEGLPEAEIGLMASEPSTF